MHCRSELARDEPENTTGCQVSRVIVDDHHEQPSVDRLFLQSVPYPGIRQQPQKAEGDEANRDGHQQIVRGLCERSTAERGGDEHNAIARRGCRSGAV